MAVYPDFLRQHGCFGDLEPEERQAWVQEAAGAARGAGMTWMRASVDNADHPTMALFEGWKVRPDDEGPPHWQMTQAA
jgi:hypothetical protein